MRTHPLIDFGEYSGLRAVISGGQTGADFGGLVAAKSAHLNTGGWAPLGWRTAEGANPKLQEWGLTQHHSDDYAPRTKMNVLDSDGTLIVASNPDSPGCALTRRLCIKHNKPVFSIHPHQINNDTIEKCVNFIVSHRIYTLNVAGNRDFSNRVGDMATIHYDSTIRLLSAAFAILADRKLLATTR